MFPNDHWLLRSESLYRLHHLRQVRSGKVQRWMVYPVLGRFGASIALRKTTFVVLSRRRLTPSPLVPWLLVSALDAIDLRELEACLDHESSQKQETSITDSCTANESSENKNKSVLVEFWRYIVTFCFMGIMSCLHPGSRRAITDSAENLSKPTYASREPKDESKVDAAVS